MTKQSFFSLPAFWHRRAAFVLIAFFLLGHVLGILLSGSAGTFFLSSMRTVVSSRVSIVSLLSSAVLPFLFSAFAVWLAQPMLLIPIAFWKAFLFSYLGYGLFSAWGSAGWLIAGLVMFGKICAMPLLCWYWLRYVCGRRFEVPVFCLILGALTCIGMVEYYLIVPFLGSIITF